MQSEQTKSLLFSLILQIEALNTSIPGFASGINSILRRHRFADIQNFKIPNTSNCYSNRNNERVNSSQFLNGYYPVIFNRPSFFFLVSLLYIIDIPIYAAMKNNERDPSFGERGILSRHTRSMTKYGDGEFVNACSKYAIFAK